MQDHTCRLPLKCPCGFCYVGKTKKKLRIRISEHKSSIRNRDERSPVASTLILLAMSLAMVQGPLQREEDRKKKLIGYTTYCILQWAYVINCVFVLFFLIQMGIIDVFVFSIEALLMRIHTYIFLLVVCESIGHLSGFCNNRM